MNVVDSSAWLEYFADGPNAGFFAPAIETVDILLVPTISIYEVFKRVTQQRSEAMALQAIAQMQLGVVIELTTSLAMAAARLSSTHRLPMADSIIFATARANNAVVWTQDADFEGLPNVQYTPKGGPASG